MTSTQHERSTALVRSFDFSHDDRERIHGLAGALPDAVDRLAADFNVWLGVRVGCDDFFPEHSGQAARAAQREYWQQLVNAEINAEYADRRSSLGASHNRAGVPQWSHAAGMSFALQWLVSAVYAANLSHYEAQATVLAFGRLCQLDTALVSDGRATAAEAARAEQDEKRDLVMVA